MKKKLKYNPKKCLSCRTCEIACAVGHSETKQLLCAIKEKQLSLPRVKVFTYQGIEGFPVACRHCDEPKCVISCISCALTKDAETGMVNYDKDKCVGCWMCVMACPYGAIRPNYKTKKTIRCDLCSDVDTPRCLESCPVKVITLEEL